MGMNWYKDRGDPKGTPFNAAKRKEGWDVASPK